MLVTRVWVSLLISLFLLLGLPLLLLLTLLLYKKHDKVSFTKTVHKVAGILPYC